MKTLFPAAEDATRITSLDGLRAVAILLVVFSHLLGTRNFPGREWLRYTGDLGNLGVRVFFVISGFLITQLLLRELELTGTISLRRFYLRRACRIFPAFYVCLGVLALLDAGHVLKLHPYDLLCAGTYTINYRTAVERSWNVGHLWSLAVEEQFYLLWPAALRLLGRSPALAAAGAVVVLAPLVRLATWRYFPAGLPGMKWQFQTVCDSLATGCLLAGLQGWLAGQAGGRCHRMLSSNAMLLLPGLLLVLNWLDAGHPRWNFALGQTGLNFGTALLLQHCLMQPRKWAGRALNWRPLAVLGVLSYSLYLWQQLFLNHYATGWMCAFPWNVILALGAAYLSYALVERPVLDLRRKYCVRFSPSAPRGKRGPG